MAAARNTCPNPNLIDEVLNEGAGLDPSFPDPDSDGVNADDLADLASQLANNRTFRKVLLEKMFVVGLA